MAYNMCIPLTENEKLKQELWAEYNYRLSELAARDGSQGEHDVIQSKSLVSVRRF